jgi:hypothetical protein
MTTAEQAYLAMVIVAFLIFAVALAGGTLWSRAGR